jgi:oxaloacetate decarboxylase gamma subunit
VDESSLLNEGLTLMLFGMGFVFLFLTLLVIATSIMSKLMTKYEKTIGVIPDEGVSSPSTFIPRHGHLLSKLPVNKKMTQPLCQ